MCLPDMSLVTISPHELTWEHQGHRAGWSLGHSGPLRPRDSPPPAAGCNPFWLHRLLPSYVCFFWVRRCAGAARRGYGPSIGAAAPSAPGQASLLQHGFSVRGCSGGREHRPVGNLSQARENPYFPRWACPYPAPLSAKIRWADESLFGTASGWIDVVRSPIFPSNRGL